MAVENLLYEKRDGIVFLMFNRPKVLNALNRKTMQELNDALIAARDDDEVRVLLLTGADIGEIAVQTPVNGKEPAALGKVHDGGDRARSGNAAGTRPVSGSDAFRPVRRHRGHAGANARVSGKASAAILR